MIRQRVLDAMKAQYDMFSGDSAPAAKPPVERPLLAKPRNLAVKPTAVPAWTKSRWLRI